MNLLIFVAGPGYVSKKTKHTPLLSKTETNCNATTRPNIKEQNESVLTITRCGDACHIF